MRTGTLRGSAANTDPAAGTAAASVAARGTSPMTWGKARFETTPSRLTPGDIGKHGMTDGRWHADADVAGCGEIPWWPRSVRWAHGATPVAMCTPISTLITGHRPPDGRTRGTGATGPV